MKRITLIRLRNNEEVQKEIYNNVEQFIDEFWKKRYPYNREWILYLPMNQNHPAFNYVLKTAKQHRITYDFFQDTYYSKSEIEKMPFFEMKISLITELEGTDARDYGTEFSGGCEVCGIGSELKSDLLIDKKLLKKHNIGNANPCIFVSEKLKEIILSNNLSGVSFNHRVKDYKGRKIDNYYVMEIENVLPKMSSLTWFDELKSHYRCGHSTIYLQSYIKYDENALTNAKDFNLSCEYIDNFHLRPIIVSAKVKEIFRKNKIYEGFFPICIGNDNDDFMPPDVQI